MSLLFEQVEFLDRVDSTNEYLKRYVQEGIARAVVAREQTAGKGRHGRTWHSPRDQGLYVSYLLYPDWSQRQAPLLNGIAALSVMKVLEGLKGTRGKRIRLKPPNDVLIDGRKVCGILVELSTAGDQVKWAIIGIGVNLRQQRFAPEKYNVKPTSLALEGIEICTPSEFYAKLTRNLEKRVRLCSEGFEEIETGIQREAERPDGR